MALAIMSVTAACAYDLLRSGLVRFRQMDSLALQKEEASVALTLLSKDIRCAMMSPDRPEIRFVGYANGLGEHLEFYRPGLLSENRESQESIEYLLMANTETGEKILRRTATSNFLDKPRSSDLCDHLQSFEAKFFDGKNWQTTWGWDEAQNKPFEGIRALPLLVAVTLTFTSADHKSWQAQRLIPVMTSVLNWDSDV